MKGGKAVVLFFLLLSLRFNVSAQSDPCDCSDGYVYAPPDASYDSCDPFNLAAYCVPGDVPVDTNIYLLVIVALVYLAWLGRNYYKADLYKSK
jgi:hypothetical protein